MMVHFSLEKYLQELKYLVNIESPPYYPIGTGKVAAFFQHRYEDVGFLVKKLYPSKDVGPLLIITNGEFAEYDYLFLGHMDTVFPVGTVEERPFYVDGSYAYGPGVGDMKAGLLNLSYVLTYLKKQGILDDIRICVVHNSDHEGIGSKYSLPILESYGRKSRYCLVLEAARASGAAVSERRGINRYHISFKGVASHTGNNPTGGCSAIHEMAYWVLELQDLTKEELETTVNVTMVSGGLSANVIPPKADIVADCRFMEISEIQRIKERIEKLQKRPFINGLKITYEETNFRPPMKMSREAKDVCARITQIAERKLGIELEWIKAGGASDGNYISALGVTTLDGLGAIAGNPHSEDEYILIESVEPRINLLLEIILLLCEKKCIDEQCEKGSY